MERRYSSLAPKPNHILECVAACACLLTCCLMFFSPSISFLCKNIIAVFTVLSEDLFCDVSMGIHNNSQKLHLGSNFGINEDTQETKPQSIDMGEKRHGLTGFHI